MLVPAPTEAPRVCQPIKHRGHLCSSCPAPACLPSEQAQPQLSQPAGSASPSSGMQVSSGQKSGLPLQAC